MTQRAKHVNLASLDDYENVALQIDKMRGAYLWGGAGDGTTSKNNRLALDQLRLIPRVLRDVAGGSTQLELLGQELAHPMIVAPMALQKLAHSDGERATAMAAAAQEAPMVVSSQTSIAPETFKNINAPRWFQLYIQPEREMTCTLLRRAEASHARAIVVTVDAPLSGLRYQEIREGFALPNDIRPAMLDDLPKPAPITLSDEQSAIFDGIMPRAATWDELSWLRDQTDLPILLKGILHPDDAKCAVARGMDGVIVSNHGGRILPGLVSSISMLPMVRAALGSDKAVLFDSGIRSGVDVFRALACGADAVLVGQPIMWGLAANGAHGVSHVLRILRDELEMTMAVCGARVLADIGRDMLHVPDHFT